MAGSLPRSWSQVRVSRGLIPLSELWSALRGESCTAKTHTLNGRGSINLQRTDWHWEEYKDESSSRRHRPGRGHLARF